MDLLQNVSQAMYHPENPTALFSSLYPFVDILRVHNVPYYPNGISCHKYMTTVPKRQQPAQW